MIERWQDTTNQLRQDIPTDVATRHLVAALLVLAIRLDRVDDDLADISETLAQGVTP